MLAIWNKASSSQKTVRRKTSIAAWEGARHENCLCNLSFTQLQTDETIIDEYRQYSGASGESWYSLLRESMVDRGSIGEAFPALCPRVSVSSCSLA